MSQTSQAVLQPRKSPVQARSTATVEAILDATIQVLLGAGKERLTTTRVASRAGVSVGTLYQYFPNKSALLQAALQRHLDEIAAAVELACGQQAGAPPRQMVFALIGAFLGAKMQAAGTSVALHSVMFDVDGAKIARHMQARLDKAITRMLATAPGPLLADPQLAAVVLQAAMVGVSRRLLESKAPHQQFEALSRELTSFATAYLCGTGSPS